MASSISRAFTTRRIKQFSQSSEPDHPIQPRSNLQKVSMANLRHKISAPVKLIHTTNVLAYNAPDLYPQSATSTKSSFLKSDDDLSDSANTQASSPPTSPDIDQAPDRCLSPEPNHLSCYFTTENSTTSPVATHKPSPLTEAPFVPSRAPSHTKKSYDSRVREQSVAGRSSVQSQRTISTKASFNFSQSRSRSTSVSSVSTPASPSSYQKKRPQISVPPTVSQYSVPSATASPASPPRQRSQRQAEIVESPARSHRAEFSQSHHPFGQELAQVTEIAEEYGVKEKLNEFAVEEQEMAAMGLCRFSADDYLKEIKGFFVTFYDVEPIEPVTPVAASAAAPATAWI
ncbi:hypothetical protein SMACR_04288 [Sordaria macrospora]|uniref:WGS project CABT00000000 data, contig 2.19 n=2 Tax=Sordaria macrospora TaxID=5147 RepID=F7W1E6_SORMK|nr:uncharacterized protein SMAC_04288 [Sordaria macrospora k-hell]KAA8635802.1 hypothetical protein SMACR_04288 [Sordaria macrospora]KAH7626457.1 hypothetical protein B0T09DRAFT_43000 [Sordaria sp. MPI-SDFR-AT-0083]WPJ57993.1 hypothetical protein SMAC4_04288 [Sordaria macrospora]CCC04921.1 unnamed protein product [Sordaria macrospora k-hell]